MVGAEIIKELHHRLYQEVLEPYKPVWLDEVEFMPHMTIGRFSTKEELNRAYKEIGAIKDRFVTTVDSITVEIIDENENSIIETIVKLS